MASFTHCCAYLNLIIIFFIFTVSLVEIAAAVTIPTRDEEGGVSIIGTKTSTSTSSTNEQQDATSTSSSTISSKGDFNSSTSTSTTSTTSTIIDIATGNTVASCNGSTQTSFRLELTTDDYPIETLWIITDVHTNDVVYESGRNKYSLPQTLYDETYCLPSNSCYQFTILDAWGDGFNVGGMFKTFYDNIALLQEEVGDANTGFKESLTSAFFGNTCPSAQPSYSPSPTITTNPTIVPSASPSPSVESPNLGISSEPSLQPLLSPTTSSKPTSSSSPSIKTFSLPSPSWSPTTSNIPTLSPTQEIDLIAKDEYNRRYFPKVQEHPEGSFSFRPIPDCTGSKIGRVGCIGIPQSIQSEPPYFAGKLHSKPPICNERNQKCKLGIPMSIQAHSLRNDLEQLKSVNPFHEIDDEDILMNIDLGEMADTRSEHAVDINNDGHIDVIIGNQGQHNFLLLNKGDKSGTFETPIKLPGSDMTSTQFISVADVNNDGKLDIIVGNNKKQHNQLLINQGRDDSNGIIFQNPIELPGGTMETRCITVADVNNDGLIDIIIGNAGQSNQLLLNNGLADGSFQGVEAIDLPGGTLNTYTISAADVNDDGWDDIIVGNLGQKNKLLLNDGSNGILFQAATDLPGGEMITFTIDVADFNNDDKVDIIIGNSWEKNQILFNEGGGNFGEAVDLPGETSSTASSSVGDINNDGLIDIVFGNWIQTNQLLLNQGNGKFDNPIILPGGTLYTTSVSVADVDGDGRSDIIFGNRENKNQILFNKSNGRFEFPIDLPGVGTSSTKSISLADVDDDGMLDILVGNLAQKNQILLNNGDGTFRHPTDLPGGSSNTYSLSTADIDNDGDVDIIVGNDGQNNEVLLNKGDGTFHEPIRLPSGGISSTKFVSAADVDSDGWVDIVIGNAGKSNQLLLNKGNGDFQDPIDLPGGDLDTVSISIADVNDDNFVDIIIGNESQNNQVLFNEGDGSFESAIYLPDDSSKTLSLTTADVNNDGRVDIIVGNSEETNQLLLNEGNGNFKDPIDLPGGDDFKTSYISVGDINNDGAVDIVVGNLEQRNYLIMNKGDGSFQNEIILPGGASRSSFLTIADLHNDGYVDIIVGNYWQSNQFVPFMMCPDGGAQLHSKSWCFRCPSFMGDEKSFCRECMPDYAQQPGFQEICASGNDEKCPLGQRNFGEDVCSRCPDGTYYNSKLTRSVDDPSTWNDPRCVPCEPGRYAKENFAAIDTCFECKPGTFKSTKGASTCDECKEGQFQSEFGQTKCEECSIGGYCGATNKLGGGFEACPPGTYNDQTGQSKQTACQLCPAGTYSAISGGESIEVCMKCPAGTYNDKPGQDKCEPCGFGTFQQSSGQTSCDSCPDGTYADKSGFEECIQCPYRLSSPSRSKTCPFCDAEFYLNDTSASAAEIFIDPFKYCLSCAPNTLCPTNNITLSGIGVKEGYWRHSKNTQRVYECKRSDACVGSSATVNRNVRREMEILGDNDDVDIYCREGHTGPLCEACVEDDHYFSAKHRECKQCGPISIVVAEVIGIILGVLAVLFIVVRTVMSRFPSVIDVMSIYSLRAKLKIVISFYQVMSSLEDIYGVKLNSALTYWIKFLSLDILQILDINTGCLGSTKQQIMFSAVWPYILLIVVGIGMVTYSAYLKARKNEDEDGEQNKIEVYRKTYNTSCRSDLVGQQVESQDSNSLKHFEKWFIQWVIIVLYFALPTVSRGVFSAIKCRSFQDDDNDPEPGFVSYLLLDMRIECSAGEDVEFRTIIIIFVILAFIWTVLTPCGFLVLLSRIRHSIESKNITFGASACRFLWQDYIPAMYFWDVLETMRKICLMGFIILIDTANGSSKLLRLVVAIIVSVLCLCLLMNYRPYARCDDFQLAFITNYMLICCFCFGVVLKLCDEDEIDAGGNDIKGGGICNRFIGFSLDFYSASVLVAILTLGVLFMTAGLLVILARNRVKAPIVRMVSSGYPPNLELPEHCTFHVFMSHVWGTGQAKTHAIARQIQLFFPGLRVWLDVDELHDVSELERSIEASAVFLLYYSKNYFRSKNCRREIYSAITLDKPIILVYQGDESVLAELRKECISSCNDDDHSPGSAKILHKLLGDSPNMSNNSSHGPIQWLNDGNFSPTSLNRLYFRILGYLPYYEKHHNQLLKGISVPGELGPVSLKSPVNLLVCESNHGCLDLAEELRGMSGSRRNILQSMRSFSSKINLFDAKTFLQRGNDDVIYSFDTSTDSFDDSEEEEKSDHLESSSVKPTFLLLYLNEYTFGGDGRDQTEFISIIQACIKDKNINLILVHEQDISKGGCKFDVFFEEAPQKLYNPPYNLFKEMAVPMYSQEDYRTTSLRLILTRMGAK